MKRARVLAFAAALAALFPVPDALAGISEHPFRDWDAGWSMRTIVGWDSRPPKNPGSGDDVQVAAGWYPKEEHDGSFCIVLVFGKYFDEALPPPAAEGAPPAAPADPERFPKWIDDYLRRLRALGRTTVTASRKAARFNREPGFTWEGEMRTRVTSRFGEYTETYHLLAGCVRRGSFEVGVLYFLQSWNLRPFFMDSVKSLRILEAKDMAKRREELERTAQRRGGGEEGWLAKVKSHIPEGWRYVRTEHFLFVYDQRVPSAAIDRISAGLEAMRKKEYEPGFPPLEPIEALSVVKVTQDSRQYEAYGAPSHSYGYWSARERELVLYYEAEDRARVSGTAYHEGFHQYVHYALGGLSPHSWFDEGHGDYFAGFTVKEGVPKAGKCEIRVDRIRKAVKREQTLPLAALLRFSRRQFYGMDEKAPADVGLCYAQSWSLVWHLRGDGAGRRFLDAYYGALKDQVREWRLRERSAAIKESRPERGAAELPEPEADALRDAALDRALAGVDLDDMQRRWLDSGSW